MTKVALYYEAKKLQPQVEDVLVSIFDEEFPEVDEIVGWSGKDGDTTPVLILGAFPNTIPINFVKTFSQKQIIANPASITVLTAAIKNLLYPPKRKPFSYTLSMYHNNPARVFDRFIKTGMVVVDIETGGDIETMLPEETWLLSVALYDGKEILVLTEEWLEVPAHREQLKRFLLSGIKLIAHNMKFDFRTLSAALGADIKGHHDTLLMLHALNPGVKQYKLKPSCQMYLGAPEWEGEVSQYVNGKYKDLSSEGTSARLPADYHYPSTLIQKYGTKLSVGYEAIPRAFLYKYNAYDVYWTWELFEFLLRAADGDERIHKIAKFEFAMSNFFQDVEKTGVAVDEQYLEELRVYYEKEWALALDRLYDLTDNPKFNPNSWQQVKMFLAGRGIMVKSTAEKVLEKLDLEEGSLAGQFVDALLHARGISKMKGTYVEGIRKRAHSGIVYPSFLVHGTSTGRLSSAGPNIQNIPRDTEGKSLRRIFVPRDVEKRSLLSVDYSQAELRVMACMSEDEYLISLFQPDMPDFFKGLMPTAFPNADIAAWDKDTEKNNRARLKGIIYGLSYNRKAQAIAEELGMTVKEAQTIINNYFDAAPQFYEWRANIEARAVNPKAMIVSPFGRYYQAEVVAGKTKQNIVNSALAFLPQSTASDICVVAAMNVHKWAHEYDSSIVATIHDAILMDVPDWHLEEVSKRVQHEMKASAEEVFGTVVPFATEATWGKSWKGI